MDGANGKRSGKETEIFPDFKRMIYNRIFKTIYDGKKYLTNLIKNTNFQKSVKMPSLRLLVVDNLYCKG